MTLTVRVDEVMRPSGTLFDYFILDSSLLDGVSTLAPETVTTDISEDVRSVKIRRGKQRDTDEYVIGSLMVDLDNEDRQYDPSNTSSPYVGNIAPMRQAIATAVLNGVDYPLFKGYIERWGVDYADPMFPSASFDAADAFLLLSRAEMTSIVAAHGGDLTGERIERVLDLAEVGFPSDIRAIDDGNNTCGATTFGENALGYCLRGAATEAANFYVSKAGVLTFEERNIPPGAPAATFSDDGDVSSIPYLWIDQETGADLLYNRVVMAGTSSNEQDVSDQASIVDNEITSTLSRTNLLGSSDSEMTDLAELALARYSTSETRLRQVKVDVFNLSDAQVASLLALELGDRVTVERSPGVGTPSTISQGAVVIGIEDDIAGFDWLRTVTFQAGRRLFPFVLDDAELGVLDAAFLGA